MSRTPSTFRQNGVTRAVKATVSAGVEIARVDDRLLVTPKVAAAILGVTDSQIRGLICNGRIAHVLIGKRIMIPRDAINRFIPENMVLPCPERTRVPILIGGAPDLIGSSDGLKTAAAGSAARALMIADELKLRSPNSSKVERAQRGHVIPLKSL